jgi:hypothetical protein
MVWAFEPMNIVVYTFIQMQRIFYGIVVPSGLECDSMACDSRACVKLGVLMHS